MKSDAMGSMTAHEHFTRTARAASQLQSEHMARILDLSAARSRVGYVVFERTGATDLAELLRTRGALTVSDALDFTIQIADVLAEAHANGISHGSLRPARVFVSEGADGSPLLKVVGFGVLAQWSLLSAPTCLQAGDSLDDAVRYLAPEQIRLANLVDPRSDIWALGQLLYEMLLGVPAFAGPSSVATLAMIAADPIQSITAARPDVPRALESIVTRCLEKRPEGRYVTVAELVRALKPLVSAETQARIERIVRIGARSPRTTSTFMPPGNALVHIPTPGIFGTTESIPAVPTERVSRTTTPWRVGALLLLVMGTSGIAGVIGAVLTARSWARQATVSVPVLQQSPPAAGALALPKQVSEALQNEQIAQPSAAGQKEPATVTRTGIVESRTRSNTPAPASPIRAETPRAVKHPKVTSPVDSPADTKPAAPNRDHLFDDIK
jgi:serine/threonine-protein kinase